MRNIKLVSDTINRNDIDNLIEWLKQDPVPRLTKGDLTIELEEKFAKIIGTKHSVYVNSGSSAILLLLAALKQSNAFNNDIIVPALSWVTDVSTPILLGFNPILCDCNLTDLSCDLDHLEEIFKSIQSNKPTIFISVAPLGLVPEMYRIMLLCEKYNIILLEDICESMGSKFMGRMLGSFGLASMYSMYYGHHLSTIEGGFINTNDDDLYEVLISMRSHGWDRDWKDEERKMELRKQWNINDFSGLYTFYYPGLNLRSTDLQAFIGIGALDRLDDYSVKRNENFKKYNTLIKENLLAIRDYDIKFISNFAYPMAHQRKDEIVADLISNGVEVRPLIAGSIGLQPFWIKRFGKTSLVNADFIDAYGFYLPNHQDLTEEDIIFITDIINKY